MANRRGDNHLGAAAHGEDVDPVVSTQIAFHQGLADQVRRYAQLSYAKARPQLQMVEHPWFGQAPGQARPGLMLRENNLVGADPQQDLLLALAHSFANHPAHPHALQGDGGHQVGLEVVADGDDDSVELGDIDGVQSVLVGRVQGDNLGDPISQALDNFGVTVDPEYMVAAGDQIQGDTATEAAEADNCEFKLTVPANHSCSLRHREMLKPLYCTLNQDVGR